MKRNIYLNLAIVFGIVISAMLFLMFLTWTAYIAYFHINPNHKDYNRDVTSSIASGHYGFDFDLFHMNSGGVWSYAKKSSWVTQAQEGEAQLTYKKMLLPFLYLTYIQVSAMILFLSLSLMEFVKVIKSVGAIETFRVSNIRSFRRIGKFQLLYFALSSFTFVMFEQGRFLQISIELMPLILMVLAFVMAEIFKEGNKLQEENQLTV